MKKLVIGSMLLLTALGHAQENMTENPINKEFTNLIETSNNFQEYKLVKESDLKKLQSQTDAHIAELEQKIETLDENIALERQAQEPLQAQLTAANANVEQLNEEKDSISFLGILIDKVFYNVIVWTLVAILSIALIVLFVQYRKNEAFTSQAKSELTALEVELEELRRKSIEEKQRLGRELQDERNKLSRLRMTN